MSNVAPALRTNTTRPSRLIAETLVHGHSEREVKLRGEALGLPPVLVETVVSVCCCKGETPESEAHETNAD